MRWNQTRLATDRAKNGFLGEVSHAAVLCPSFYRAELISNPTGWSAFLFGATPPTSWAVPTPTPPNLTAAPAGFIVAGWLWFITTYDIIIVYHGGMMPIFVEVIPQTLLEVGKAAQYGIYWLPWIAAVALIAIGSPRRAMLPIVVAVLTTAAAVFFYIHTPDPKWWIASSAPRVLLTPLCCLLIAAAAARSPSADSRPTLPRDAAAVC